MMELTPAAQSMLQALIAMGLLSLMMFLWMYATRLPAFGKAKLDPQDAMHPVVGGPGHDDRAGGAGCVLNL